MKSSMWTTLAFAITAATFFQQIGVADETIPLVSESAQVIGQSIPVAHGSMVIVRQTDALATSAQLLIHFHGALETTRQALARSKFRGVLVVVNFKGLSSAYSKPFEQDAKLFDEILRHACAKGNDGNPIEHPQIFLSSFSAGYGAIREILKSPQNFQRIDGIVTADSIYAGLEADSPVRIVSEENMTDFQRFAKLACNAEKRFVLSHSAMATSYASTTETADYLLQKLQMTRVPDMTIKRPSFNQSSQGQRGQFVVLGFEGESGPDHLQHLRQIDVLWDLLN